MTGAKPRPQVGGAPETPALLLEGLDRPSPQLEGLGPLPTLTSLGVWIGGEHLDLSGARHLLRARTRVGATTLQVRTFTRSARIELSAELPDEPRSVVRYLDPGDGGERTCTNSARGRVELVVTRGDRVDRFATDHAAFEVAERGPGTAAVLLSD